MGREIRRVPANWEHPRVQHHWRNGKDAYQPMYNQPYIEALDEWLEQHRLWQAGQHPDQLSGDGTEPAYYAQWNNNAPEVEYYRPAWKPEDMTWWQVYETVSAGTPVTPPFATQDELIDYLVENGDFWDQKRRMESRSTMDCAPWGRASAERFVRGTGWAPSFIASAETGIVRGVDGITPTAVEGSNG